MGNSSVLKSGWNHSNRAGAGLLRPAFVGVDHRAAGAVDDPRTERRGIVALLLGYRRIELYGVDHTLLDGLCVDDANRLCRADRHYYDAGPRAPQPIYMKVPHVPYTMSVYLAEVAELFRGHEVLRDYAASLGARIVNRTRGSMIDAYERGAE